MDLLKNGTAAIPPKAWRLTVRRGGRTLQKLSLNLSSFSILHIRLEATAIRLEATAIRLEATAIKVGGHRY